MRFSGAGQDDCVFTLCVQVELTVIMRQLAVEGNEMNLQVKINASSEDEETTGNLGDNDNSYSIKVGANVTILVDGFVFLHASQIVIVTAAVLVELLSHLHRLHGLLMKSELLDWCLGRMNYETSLTSTG